MYDLIKIVSLIRPNKFDIRDFYEEQHQEEPNFDSKRLSQRIERQMLELEIGQGKAHFEKAKDFIRNWRVFETPEGTPYPPLEAPQVGQTTINLLREFGLWFRLACRITNVIDQTERFGFTFETLPGHVECGWETFLVRYDSKTEQVYYSIQSESTHRFLLTRLCSPLVHYLQRRYKSNSAKRIQELMLVQARG